MKVLVIYDLIPEEQKRAIIEMTNDEYEFFSKAHNQYINSCEDERITETMLVIDAAFSDKNNVDETNQVENKKQQEYFGKWVNNLKITDISDVDKMICTGLIV